MKNNKILRLRKAQMWHSEAGTLQSCCWVQCLLAIHCSACSLPSALQSCLSFQWDSLRETEWSCAGGYQLEIASESGMGLVSFQLSDSILCRPVHAAKDWVHKCFGLLCLEGLVSCVCSIPSGSYILSASSSVGFPELRGSDGDRQFRTECYKVSQSACCLAVALCVCSSPLQEEVPPMMAEQGTGLLLWLASRHVLFLIYFMLHFQREIYICLILLLLYLIFKFKISYNKYVSKLHTLCKISNICQR